MSAPPVIDLPGTPEEAGAAHARHVAHFFEPAFFDPYIESLARINRFERDDLAVQARHWLAALPEHHQAEIGAMADGAGATLQTVTEFLYADIARPTRDAAPIDPANPEAVSSGAPMCSAVLCRSRRDGWVARNCDWLYATLVRGTACVVHRLPHRIPVIACGIAGDIDVDTGMNAEGLWLHLHTLLATDDPPRDRTTISWLFWAREALETCATLDELEAFIGATSRDRGVIAVAMEGRTGHGAVFECTRAGHERHDLDGQFLAATNHPPRKVMTPDRIARSRAGSTVARHGAMCSMLADAPPDRLPDDLVRVLADPRVEMRTPTHLRTIYSAVARPESREIWFSSGTSRGEPAASTGRWTRVRAPF